MLRNFLTAQTAKDSAIMISLQRVTDAGDCGDEAAETVIADRQTEAVFRCRVAFVDLDLKRACRMPAYVALDRAIVTAAGVSQ